METLIGRYPVLTYVALTFAVSWGGMLIAVGRAGPTTSDEHAALLLVIASIAMLAGPGESLHPWLSQGQRL